MARTLAVAALAWLAVAACAHAEGGAVELREAWTRPTPGGARTAAIYLTAVNHGAATDRIVAAQTPAAERAEIHVDIMDGNVMRMRHVMSVDVPAGGETAFKPGSFHVMLTGLKAPLKAGDSVPLTLTFEGAGAVTATVTVRN